MTDTAQFKFETNLNWDNACIYICMPSLSGIISPSSSLSGNKASRICHLTRAGFIFCSLFRWIPALMADWIHFLLIWMANYRFQWENACVFRGDSWIWNKIRVLNSLMIFEAMLSDQKIEMELGTWSDFIDHVSGLDSIETIIMNVAKAFQLPVRTDISWKRMCSKLCNTLFSEICHRLVLRHLLWSQTQLAHPNSFLGSLKLVPGLPKQWNRKGM